MTVWTLVRLMFMPIGTLKEQNQADHDRMDRRQLVLGHFICSRSFCHLCTKDGTSRNMSVLQQIVRVALTYFHFHWCYRSNPVLSWGIWQELYCCLLLSHLDKGTRWFVNVSIRICCKSTAEEGGTQVDRDARKPGDNKKFKKPSALKRSRLPNRSWSFQR